MARFGLTAADYASDEDAAPVGVWPDNLPAVNLFIATLTQWRVGPTGCPTGLDYGVLPEVLRMLGRPPADAHLFNDIRTLEGEALTVMAEQKD